MSKQPCAGHKEKLQDKVKGTESEKAQARRLRRDFVERFHAPHHRSTALQTAGWRSCGLHSAGELRLTLLEGPGLKLITCLRTRSAHSLNSSSHSHSHVHISSLVFLVCPTILVTKTLQHFSLPQQLRRVLTHSALRRTDVGSSTKNHFTWQAVPNINHGFSAKQPHERRHFRTLPVRSSRLQEH